MISDEDILKEWKSFLSESGWAKDVPEKRFQEDVDGGFSDNLKNIGADFERVMGELYLDLMLSGTIIGKIFD